MTVGFRLVSAMAPAEQDVDAIALQEDGLICADGRPLTGELARSAGVFGGGPLLAAVQKARLFKDSKHFVDMPLKEDPEIVLAEFERLEKKTEKEVLRSFVEKYFEDVGSDLDPWSPSDFQESPPFLAHVEEKRKAWAKALNGLWATLGRKSKAHSQQRCSSLPLRNPTIVPGGRFLETYYWDTFWVIRGLLVCSMVETAKGVIGNLLDLVKDFGFIPNGTRVYYLDRSQPPLLTDMAMAIFDVTGDKEWLSQVLPLLIKEYNFWMSPESGQVVQLEISGEMRHFNVYHSQRKGPRPESYFEDLETARSARESGLEPKSEEVFQGLCAGAESGWDFSTRWMDDSDEKRLSEARLETIKTHHIVPVDLNCFLVRVEEGLARAHDLLANESGAQKYRDAAAKRKKDIEEVLWNDVTKCYHDYRLDKGRFSKVIALSNWAAPLWAGLQGHEVEAFLTSLHASGLLQTGGAATTAVVTDGRTQWDAPNAWPPLQHMLIEGLERLGSVAAKDLAQEMTERWLQSCQMAWEKSGFMYEKYNASKPGEGGGGGEYEPQVGFGWSNGVALVLLAKHSGCQEETRRCTLS
ncbi:unnamed protein product [Durusdinium trenchii]|uniref:Uncharacterized protein n=2 Tax=Durusdinium trenchii TaxID=1381693 RepID=A0ABP0QY66_9DINO